MNEIHSPEYIYESPDGGNTVYRRKHGQDERELYIQKEPDLFTYADIREIQELSKTNSSIKKALDNLLVIYYTIKDDTKT
jgi:hypothetical protein